MLQWGRGLSPRIGHSRSRVHSLAAICFNGAAVCHRGSATRSARGWVVPYRASMGPRSVTADRRPIGLPCGLSPFASMGPRSVTADRRHLTDKDNNFIGFASMGPRSVTADRSVSVALRCVTGLLASMGPRSVTADRPSRFALGVFHVPASMGPRSVTADRGRPSTLTASWPPCFNGAAVCHRGSGTRPFRPGLDPLVLQWGRGLSPRIGGRAGCALGDNLADASMGPRSVTADRLCFALWLEWFRSCFNGAAVCHRGSVFEPDPAGIHVLTLQWGRGLSPRIGWA